MAQIADLRVQTRRTGRKANMQQVAIGIIVSTLALAAAIVSFSPQSGMQSANQKFASHRVPSGFISLGRFQGLAEVSNSSSSTGSSNSSAPEVAAPSPSAESASPSPAAKSSEVKDASTDNSEKNQIQDVEGVAIAASIWAQGHPQQAAMATTLQYIGGFLTLVGVAFVLYSEINTVFFYRDKDAVKAADLQGIHDCLSARYLERELWWGKGLQSQWRVTLSGIGIAGILLGTYLSFSSECPMVAYLQDHYDMSKTTYSGNCPLLAVLLAIANGIGLSCLLTGVSWSCTRLSYSLFLIFVSITEDFVSGSESPAVLITWILIVCAFLAGLWHYIENSESETEESNQGLLGSKPREFC
eukprot:747593-Hanusia_phi.AAC.1